MDNTFLKNVCQVRLSSAQNSLVASNLNIKHDLYTDT